MMKKIAIFKTIRITTMGYVIEDSKKMFPGCKITIITASQYSIIYNLFSNVNTINVGVEPFQLEKTKTKILQKINEESFDYAIIPTEGNFNSYNNVLSFANSFTNKSRIYYYIYPNKFYKFSEINNNNFLFKINKFLSILFAIPILFLMLVILLVKSFFNKFIIN